MNLSARLNDLTNAAIVVLVILVGVRFLAPGSAPAAKPYYQAGDIVRGVSKSELAGSARTLILQLRSTCPHCGPVIPFYRRIVKQLRAERRGVRVIAVAMQERAVLSSICGRMMFLLMR